MNAFVFTTYDKFRKRFSIIKTIETNYYRNKLTRVLEVKLAEELLLLLRCHSLSGGVTVTSPKEPYLMHMIAIFMKTSRCSFERYGCKNLL